MSARRLYVPAVLGLLAAGGLAFFAASRTWMSITIGTPGLPRDRVEVSGADAYPLVSALAVVVAASALAVLATGPRMRRVVGGLVVVASAAAAWTMLDGNDALDAALADAAGASPAWTETTKLGDVDVTAWDLVTWGSLVLSTVLGGLVVALAHHWPRMGQRFESPESRPTTEGDLWTAMDEGRDPTE